MQTLFGLHHHRHTAKRLPHHQTSYMGLFFILLISGLTLGLMQQTNAVNLTLNVKAKVPAPIPNSPAVITKPANGSQFSVPQIEISGNCPVISPAVIISVWSGSIMLGSSICSPSGTFSILATLPPGDNLVIPKITTITDDPGPTGSAVAMAYHPPQLPGTSANIQLAPIEAIDLRVGQSFIAYTPNEPVKLSITIGKGVGPYTVNVNWGDGTSSTWTFEEPGEQVVEHVYKTNIPLKITINATDSLNQTAQITVAATSLSRYYGSGNERLENSFVGSVSGSTFRVVWLVYGLAVMVAIAFWLKHHSRQLIAVTPRGRHVVISKKRRRR